MSGAVKAVDVKAVEGGGQGGGAAADLRSNSSAVLFCVLGCCLVMTVSEVDRGCSDWRWMDSDRRWCSGRRFSLSSDMASTQVTAGATSDAS